MAAPAPSKDLVVDWVIDVDTHITEPPDLFSSRLPAKWADRAPRIHMNERGLEEWTVGDSALRAVSKRDQCRIRPCSSGPILSQGEDRLSGNQGVCAGLFRHGAQFMVR